MMISLLSTLILSFLAAGRVAAAPAYPKARNYRQPNGKTVPLCLHGNEQMSYLATCNNWQRGISDDDNFFARGDDDGGYTVVKKNDGAFVFAKECADGDLCPTEYLVGDADPKKLGIKKKLLPKKRIAPEDLLRKRNPRQQFHNLLRKRLRPGDSRRKLWFDIEGDDLRVPSCINNSTSTNPCVLKHLVVMVRFSDHINKNLPDQSAYNSLYNDAGHGSVKHYFEEQSYGALLVDTTVVGWIDVSQTQEYAVAGDFGKNKAQTRETWNEAMRNLENDPSYNIDFADFDVDNDGFIDALTIVHSGMYSFYSYYGLLKTRNYLGATTDHSLHRCWSRGRR